MNIPKDWLSEYADINIAIDDYVASMIMIGNGIEGTEDLGAQIQNVVTGQIKSLTKHADSDHLWICAVDIGKETIQIVTGAQNLYEGAIVPVALHGSTLPGGKQIKKGKLRGVESCGMLCSGTELEVPNELYPNCSEEGILIFNQEQPLGVDVRPIFGKDDTVIEFEVLANRPDCLSVLGMARETSVALGVPFNKPQVPTLEEAGIAAKYVTIEVQDATLCPRYAGCVIENINIAPSPMWMRKRLQAAGIRPISNIVDITNYVMLETGHPMHAFDLAKVKDQKIIVRRAIEGETLTTLDGKERPLTTDMLVIADGIRATGVAGVMGGEESEITEHTKTILFEVAQFDRTSIRLTSRALGLRTEASSRFEKGVNAGTIPYAMARACQLVEQLGAGTLVGGMIDLCAPIAPAPAIALPCQGARDYLGVEIPDMRMLDILNSLEIETKLQDGILHATVPSHRLDLETRADLCEEILRVYGYDKIPSTLPRGEISQGKRSARMDFQFLLRRLLTGMGLYEAYNYTFFSPKDLAGLHLPEGDERLSPIPILNPLGEDTSLLRTSLVPAMVATLGRNMSRGNDDVSFFEIAPVFMKNEHAEDGLPEERQMLCIGLYGPYDDEKAEAFYQLRTIVDSLLDTLGIPFTLAPEGDPFFHPGRKATMRSGEHILGQIGEIHPNVLEEQSINKRIVVAQLNVQMLMELHAPIQHVQALPRYPATTRDIALVMDEDKPIGHVMTCIQNAGGQLLEKATLFDVYRGTQLGENKKSVAFSLTLRAPDRTLTDEQTQRTVDAILAACQKSFGATLRA